MKIQKHESWYENNPNYTTFLNSQDDVAFDKYVNKILEYLPDNGRFLDIGCGTGITLSKLRDNNISKTNAIGVEISKSSLEICRKKKLSAQLYNGKTLPIASRSIDVVGSINVLEHTNNPISFLNEEYRVVKKGGYIIILCPNFLSITNGYHIHTRGIIQKVRNIISLLYKYIKSQPHFETMNPTLNDTFKPDDDAVNATNPIDILSWSKKNNLKLIYWSSQQREHSSASLLDRGLIRVFLGSCFFIFQK